MGKVFKAPMQAADVARLAKIKVVPPTIDWKSGSEGAEVYFQSKGAKSLQETLLQLGSGMMEVAVEEMTKIAAEVILDAKENYVPVDTGNLRDSGNSDEYIPNRGQTVAQIAMWFGGVVTKEEAAHGVKDVRGYALEQHENLEYHHPAMDYKTGFGGPVGGGPPGSGTGGPKYLERPLQVMEPKVVPRIASRIAEAMAEAGGTITNPAFIAFAGTDV